MILNVTDFDKFQESIGVAVKNRRLNLIVVDEDEKIGETKEIKKDSCVFG